MAVGDTISKWEQYRGTKDPITLVVQGGECGRVWPSNFISAEIWYIYFIVYYSVVHTVVEGCLDPQLNTA